MDIMNLQVLAIVFIIGVFARFLCLTKYKASEMLLLVSGSIGVDFILGIAALKVFSYFSSPGLAAISFGTGVIMIHLLTTTIAGPIILYIISKSKVKDEEIDFAEVMIKYALLLIVSIFVIGYTLIIKNQIVKQF